MVEKSTGACRLGEGVWTGPEDIINTIRHGWGNTEREAETGREGKGSTPKAPICFLSPSLCVSLCLHLPRFTLSLSLHQPLFSSSVHTGWSILHAAWYIHDQGPNLLQYCFNWYKHKAKWNLESLPNTTTFLYRHYIDTCIAQRLVYFKRGSEQRKSAPGVLVAYKPQKLVNPCLLRAGISIDGPNA